MKPLILGRVLLAALSLPALGCNAHPGRHPELKLVPVHGVVRLNGKPVGAARVTFMNSKLGVSAYGLSDDEGRFTLTTFEPGDGTPPGSYQITVTKVQDPGHASSSAPPAFRRGGAAPQPRAPIPQQYANPQTSGLTAEVLETGNDEIAVELKGSAQ